MSMTFAGRVAVVTGAGAGIGKATALAFAAEGLCVVAADVDVHGGQETVRQIQAAGGIALFVRCNVTLEAEVKQLMAQAISHYGRLDYAFNNAGIEIEHGRLADGTQDEHVQHHWLHDALIVRVHASSACFGLIGLPMTRISLEIE